MTKFIPAVPRLTAKCDGDISYYKPSFSYYVDPDKTGVINGRPYHGVVVAKLNGGARNLANLWTKRDAFMIRELRLTLCSTLIPILVPLVLSLRARLTVRLMISGMRMRV